MMELHTNSSNNTIYADADGHIAYFHSNFVPKRDDRFDWTKPVDGSDPATEWHGVHGVDDSPHVVNPPSGWLYNTNNWPWSAAGPNSPKQADFPAYVDAGRREPARAARDPRAGEPEGLHARAAARRGVRQLSHRVRAARCRRSLKAYDSAPRGDSLKAKLAEPIAVLREWDYRWSASSVPTSLAVFWGEALAALTRRDARRGRHAGRTTTWQRARRPAQRLEALAPRVGQAHARLRHLEDAVGRDQPLPAAHRRHRAAVQRRGAEHPGGVHLGAVGLARVVRRAHLPGHEEEVRHERQQLRRGGRVREDSVRARAVTAGGESGDPRSTALQRSGGAVRGRETARGLLLSRPARGAHGARVSPRRIRAVIVVQLMPRSGALS